MNNDHQSRRKGKNDIKSIKTSRKRMPVWLLVITDILLAAICLGAFSFYQLVLPKKLSSDEMVVATAADSSATSFKLPDDQSADTKSKSNSSENTDASVADNSDDTGSINGCSTDSSSNSRSVINGNYTNYTNTGTDSITADKSDSKTISSEKKTITKMNSYKSDNIEFTTNKVEIGTAKNKITYYLSDIYVTNVKYLKTAFATNTFGRNLTDISTNMAKQNNALLAISGDYYGNSENSFVIRNGILYRKTRNDADVCVLFTDGTMKTYSSDNFNGKQVIKQGAWQAWTFGPALLDGSGNILDAFNTTDYLYGDQPRSVIGYVEPGHYVFAVVDGRYPGYSRGANLNELAQIMVDAGCVTAYNMDGGKSASMVFKGKYVNKPAQGGRAVSDIIYIGE